MKQKIIDLTRALLILYAFYYAGELLAHLVPFGIPGSIFGLLLLFLGLTTQIIRVKWIFYGTNLFIRYMGVLFIPASVGIIKYSDLLLSQAKALLIPNLISSLLTLVIFGVLADYLFMRRSFARLRTKVLKRRAREGV
ncbi:hypothetical protein A4G18_02175 [Pasteurellaceae bacterium Pebbles2]|nr:hypothetical protein [Pasteurellaceae bacterium Pebbles2]